MEIKNSVIKEIKEKYPNEYINVNEKDYVSSEVFSSVIVESTAYECILGALIQKYGKIKITDDDILNYLSNQLGVTNIVYSDKEYIVDFK